jgi:splicing factor 3B subunit 3
MDIGEVQDGRSRSRFLAIGCEDQTMKLLSLDPDSCLERISVQALPKCASAVFLIEMKNNVGAYDADQT